MVAASMLVAAAVAPGPERTAILDAARAPVAAALGKPVRFLVRTLERGGDWAFLLAEMQDAGGRPVDYAGTPFAEDAAQGVKSRDVAALLRRQGGRWRVVEHAIGPTDMVWVDWPMRHRGAPAGIFPRY